MCACVCQIIVYIYNMYVYRLHINVYIHNMYVCVICTYACMCVHVHVCVQVWYTSTYMSASLLTYIM